MEEKQKTLSATGFSGKYLVASLFILSGILLFARNMGWITAELFSTIVSWYSLFIILGIYSMIRRHFVGGIILLLIGEWTSVGIESSGTNFRCYTGNLATGCEWRVADGRYIIRTYQPIR